MRDRRGDMPPSIQACTSAGKTTTTASVLGAPAVLVAPRALPDSSVCLSVNRTTTPDKSFGAEIERRRRSASLPFTVIDCRNQPRAPAAGSFSV